MQRAASPLTDVATGVLAGLLASFVSLHFQNVWNAVQERATGQKAEGGEAQPEPATQQAADKLAEAVLDRPVPEPWRDRAGVLVHYITGAVLGGAYGLLARVWPVATTGFGAGYGVALNLILNDGVVPALGLAPSPIRTPPMKQVYAATSHLVFGLALEASRRILRRLL